MPHVIPTVGHFKLLDLYRWNLSSVIYAVIIVVNSFYSIVVSRISADVHSIGPVSK